MDIKNHVKIDTKTTNELYAAKYNAKDDKLTTGQKIAEQTDNSAVSWESGCSDDTCIWTGKVK